MPVSYSKFKYADILALGITVENKQLFEKVTPVEPSAWLKETLLRYGRRPATSEKAKSEFIITPILEELSDRNDNAFNIFSGDEFNVDAKRGLKGRSDFILSTVTNTPIITSPVISVVEAKKSDFEFGNPQCIAQMYAAQLFNAQNDKPYPIIYGAVSTGNTWQFIRLEGMTAYIDTEQFHTRNLPELLGAFQQVVNFYIK